MKKSNCFLFLLLFAFTAIIGQTTHNIDDPEDLTDLNLSPGDEVVLANGTYSTDERIKFLGTGTANNPITFRPETPGGVVFTGGMQMNIAGEYLIVDGFYWNGGFGASNFIQFRDGTTYAQNCTFQNCAINGLVAEPGDAAEAAAENSIIKHRWVVLYGNYNNVLNCSFMNKDTAGALILTENEYNASPDEVANTRCDEVGHTISNNYFYNYTKQDPSLSNAGDSETIRVGTSEYQNVNSATTVSGNYFVQADGENEIISNKSMNNTYINNTFRRCRGSLVMRHGANATVDGNYFLGENVEGTGGIRIADSNHQITNNYIQNCISSVEQIPWNNGLTFVGGNTNSVQNCNSTSVSNNYQDVENINFSNNTFINTHSPFYFNATRDGADDVFGDVTNNLIYFESNNRNNSDVLNGSYSEIGTNLGFSGNVYNISTAIGRAASGFSQESITITANGEIFTHNQSGKGASINNAPITDSMVGNGIGACFIGAEGNNITSCDGTTPPTPINSLTVSSINEFDADGGSETIDVNANIDWTVSENASWISLNRTSGSDNGTISVTVSENTSTNDRSATITITGSGISRSITVSQEGADDQTPVSSGISLNFINSYTISGEVSEPSGLAFDKLNNQLFTVSDTDDIYRLSITGDVLETYDLSGDLEGVSTYNDPNTLLVAIEDTFEIIEYNFVTGVSTSHTMNYDNQGDPSDGIEGVTYNNNTGEIYFLNEKNPGALIVANSNFNVTGEYELTFAEDYSASYYVSETNELWLGSDDASAVYRCNTDGSVIESFDMRLDGDELDKLEGIAIDYDNQLLYVVTDGGGELLVYEISTETTDDRLTVSSIDDFDADGGSQTIDVSANIDWIVSENASWVSVDTTSGFGDGSVTITASENTSTDERAATVTITGGDITRTINLRQEGEEVIIGTPGSCTPGTNLSLDASIASFSDQENTTNNAGNIIDGDDGNRWSAMTFPQNVVIDLGSAYNVNEINLLPFSDRAYQFLVEGSTTSASSGFSTLTDATDNTSGGSNIHRTFDSQNVRYVRLTITGASGYTGPWASIEDFEIICAGDDNQTDSLTISSINDFDAEGGSQTVDVTANIDWTVSENASWISIDTTSGSGDDSVTITASENTSTDDRTATVTFTGADITRTIEIRQEGEEIIIVTPGSCTPGANLSLDASIASFSDQQNTTNNAGNIIDGNPDNRWSAMTFPQNVVIDLGSAYNVNEINLLPFSDRAYQFLVEGSTTSASSGFSTLTDATDNTSGGSNINRTFDSQNVRYVRLTITGASGYTGPWASIEDFEIICAGDDNQTDSLTVSSINDFDADGGSQTIDISANIDWTVSENASWVSVDTTGGSGDDSVTITTSENTSTNDRNATVTITGGDITRAIEIRQEGEEVIIVTPGSCTPGTNLSLNASITSFSDQENTTNNAGNIIDGDDGNRWSAMTFPQNVVIDLGNAYDINEINLLPFSDRAYQFLVEGSTTSATSGFSTLTDATDNTAGGSNINRTFDSQNVRYVRLTITGASGYTGPWASVEDFEIICAGDDNQTDRLIVSSINEFDTDGGSQTIDISANIDWTVSENTSWVSVNTTGGSGDGSVTITASENTSTNDRTATVTITGGNITRTIEIRQEGTSITNTNLDPNRPPSENFDLTNWNINVPIDRNDGTGRSTNIERTEFNDGYELKDVDGRDYFFTGADGGMVFRNYPKDAPKTSPRTSYSRVELREILTDNTTASRPQNNWYFSSSDDEPSDAGGIDGILTATLAVNHVTTDGNSNHKGRVIVGQIHASDNEPNRLYYHKLPEHERGAIYVVHEDADGEETWYNLIGNYIEHGSDSGGLNEDIEESEDGVALNEQFSYRIEVIGNDQWVTISRPGKSDVTQYIDMSDSDYENDYMYFKAGAYSQNNTTDLDNDYDEVTFYSLSQSHDTSSSFNKNPISQESDLFAVTAFPNPYTENITISVSNNSDQEISSLELSDLSGRIIIQQPVNANEVTLNNLGGLSQGVYLIRVRNSKNKIETFRIMKN